MRERFDEHVDRTSDCWIWTAHVESKGYGQFRQDGRSVMAHRAFYEMLVGPIPDGMTIDHLCRNRRCVRPEHLEPVTNRENVLRGTNRAAENARKTHCKNGHPLSGENVALTNGGRRRRCRICFREWQRGYLPAYRRRRRAEQRAA